jgi:glutamate-ammonia-ligase adenylyltransferase
MSETIASCTLRMPPLLPDSGSPDFLSDLTSVNDDLPGLLADHSPLEEFLKAVLAGSPYLRGLMLRDAGFAVRCLREPADGLIDEIVNTARNAWREGTSSGALMTAIRLGKRRAALLAGLCDLAGLRDGDKVTRWITAIADATLNASVDFLLAEAHAQAKLVHNDPAAPSEGSGFFVLAMGKYGAYELNYSSDIDLMVFYDPQVVRGGDGVDVPVFFVRMTRTLVAMMQDMTGDGYVFRMDLRLRPDPRSTPLAMSVDAAMSYYESMGQNWERAALIKARAVAGDTKCGDGFLKELQPFIFRRYLDFAAIADVQSMKRQIHAHKGHGKIAVAGHNIKLGRGGIREIEFFVQTQQLIAGGRTLELRGRRTIEMLNALVDTNWIESGVCADLTESYWFLRGIEHRLQMESDAQTHSLPSDADALARFVRFAGYETVAEFSSVLTMHLSRVQGHYGGLFEAAGELAAEEGSLSFTGAADDPDTLATLVKMGFTQPGEVAAIIRSWHHGRFAATRSERARERLTEIMPDLLAALAASADPDTAFTSFDRFLRGLPAGVQLFSLLSANRNLLDLLTMVLGTAPRMAETLSRRPRTLDAMLDPGFFGQLPTHEEMHAYLTERFAGVVSFEHALDYARVIANEQMFRIGVGIVTATANRAQAGQAYSALADALIELLLGYVTTEIEAAHGKIPGSSYAVVALGKLGGAEMMASSDLDLMIIYDIPADATGSDGPRPLSASQYFARMTQRLIAALSSPTAEGLLYEVDMRLRPSGNKGPIAVSLTGMVSYHQESAWTWERMALCRARVIAGDAGLASRVSDTVRAILTLPRDIDATRTEVLDMRKRMISELFKGDKWDLKQVPGGLVEIEFISQFLQLAHASAGSEILAQNTGLALERIGAAGILTIAQLAQLQSAYGLYQSLTQVLRLCVSGPFLMENASVALRRLLTNAADVPDIPTLEAVLEDAQKRVRAVFCEIIGDPGANGER